MTPSTSPLVDVIAGVLAEHQWYDATNELDGLRFGCACLIDDEGNETALLTETPSAHQARAVLAAISEAGAVEWGVFRITDAPVTRPFDEAKFTTKSGAEVFIKLGFLERVAKTLEPRSRITGQWEVVG